MFELSHVKNHTEIRNSYLMTQPEQKNMGFHDVVTGITANRCGRKTDSTFNRDKTAIIGVDIHHYPALGHQVDTDGDTFPCRSST